MQRSPIRVVTRIRQTDSMSDALTIEKDEKTLTLRQMTPGVLDSTETNLSFSSDAVLLNASQEIISRFRTAPSIRCFPCRLSPRSWPS